MATPKEELRFLTKETAAMAAAAAGTPCYVYDEDSLRANARAVMAFPNAFGITPRYAMKACPNVAILQIFLEEGLNIDASSGFECRRAMAAGFKPNMMSLSSQELYGEFKEIVSMGVKFNACSLNQLEQFGQAFAGTGQEVGLRFNPGAGSGGTGKTNEVKAIVAKYGLKVVRIHTHIGSGSDPAVWTKISTMSINICKHFPEVTTLNLGGGYKVGRMAYEAHKSTDLQTCGTPVKEAMQAFAKETGRELHLEIEPGTYLLANAGTLLCRIQDKAATTTPPPEEFAAVHDPNAKGAGGYTFLKIDSGMTEVLRPSLYAGQHPVVVIPADDSRLGTTEEYIVVGHCCESGDLLTPDTEDAETLMPRQFNKAEIGDLCAIEGSGAYCSGMNSKNYNSFPEAGEVMLRAGRKEVSVIRQQQALSQIYQNEIPLGAPAPVHFVKYHGIGNDFIMIDCRDKLAPSIAPEVSVKLCSPHFGVGADGVIFVLPGHKRDCDYEMVMHNSDGSIPEMCGNGIRCMAKFVQELEGTTGQEISYKIWTGAGLIQPKVRADGQVVVDMGLPILDGPKFQEQFTPAATKDGKVVDTPLTILDKEFATTCVSMGNPHAVVFVDDIASFEVSKYGPVFECAPAFPQKTNTEFVEVKSPTHLVMKVWERGAAETLACGTGACALTVAAIIAGKTTERTCRVTLPGGDLEINWTTADSPDQGKVFMTGPATRVFGATVDPGYLV